jgi:hypothetical protein
VLDHVSSGTAHPAAVRTPGQLVWHISSAILFNIRLLY